MASVIQAIVHKYELTKQMKTTFHFEQIEVSGGESLLTKKIKITQNRGFNNSTHPYLMYQRANPKKWNRHISTGLRPTNQKNVFIGDFTDQYNRKKDKVKFEFQENLLKITVYPEYFKT